MALFEMLDMDLNEYHNDEEKTGIYDDNKNFFNNLNNWFYFANDKKPSSVAGNIRCGNGDRRNEHYNPWSTNGAIVLLCKSNEAIENLRAECAKTKDGLHRFEITNGADAYFGILKIKGEERIGFAIPDSIPRRINFPYSKLGFLVFAEASKEKDTLPYMVANDRFLSYIPEEYQKFCGSKAEIEAAKINSFDFVGMYLNCDEKVGKTGRKLLEILSERIDASNESDFDRISEENVAFIKAWKELAENKVALKSQAEERKAEIRKVEERKEEIKKAEERKEEETRAKVRKIEEKRKAEARRKTDHKTGLKKFLRTREK